MGLARQDPLTDAEIEEMGPSMVTYHEYFNCFNVGDFWGNLYKRHVKHQDESSPAPPTFTKDMWDKCQSRDKTAQGLLGVVSEEGGFPAGGRAPSGGEGRGGGAARGRGRGAVPADSPTGAAAPPSPQAPQRVQQPLVLGPHAPEELPPRQRTNQDYAAVHSGRADAAPAQGRGGGLRAGGGEALGGGNMRGRSLLWRGGATQGGQQWRRGSGGGSGQKGRSVTNRCYPTI